MEQDGFKLGKGVGQGCVLSPYLLNLYAEYIMQNVGLDESQAGIRITQRNINNLRYADNTTLMAENEDHVSSPITSWQINGETVETVTDFILGALNQCRR